MGVQLDTGSGKKTLRPTINVTPLVDVVLVLLIIFMVVLPNMEEHKNIELFRTKNATPDANDEKEAIVVTLDLDGKYYIGDGELTREALLKLLKDTNEEEAGRKFLIRADKRLPYGTVRAFFRESKEIGLQKVKLAVRVMTETDFGLGALKSPSEK